MDRNAPPLNRLPPIVWVLALPMIAMEVVLSLADRGILGGAGSVGWRIETFQRFAFSPDRMRQMLTMGEFPLDGMHRLISYPLVHGSFTHALFAVVIVLALGKMVGEIFHWAAVVAVVAVATIVGALVYTAVPGVQAPLFGAYPAAYGLIGAFTFLLWVRLVAKGANQLRAFTLIGTLLAFQLLFGVLFGGGWDWVADLAGFATGFVLSFVVSPGGLGRVRDRIRQR